MATKWHSTKFKGVRYREHTSRKHGILKDKYFVIRYQRGGKRSEEKLGWQSEGWTEEKAFLELTKIKNSATLGTGPTRLVEKREIAEREKAEKRAEKERQEKENVTFCKFFEEIYFPVAQTRKKPGTYGKELQHYNIWLKPIVGAYPIRSITEIHLQKIISTMTKADLSIRYKEYVLSTFRIVWKLARDRGVVIGAYPGEKIKLPKIDNGRLRYLTHAEAETILTRLAERNTDMHDMALMSIHTGARAREVFDLTWGCVDIDQETILLKDTKNGKNRHVYMTREVKEMFSGRKRGLRNQLIFKNGRGGPVKETPETFRTVVNELGLNDDIDDPRQKIVFHSLRHTFGSWHAQRGTPPNVLKELMGHSSLKVTERYSHVSADHLRLAMEGFGENPRRKDNVLQFKQI